MPDEQSTPQSARLSEEEAHRLFARAIELDHARSAETPVEDLRTVALEAGISSEAFDQALQEIRSRVSHNPPRASDLVGARSQTLWDAIVSNAVAVPLIWLLIFLMTRATLSFGWQGMEVGILLGCILGAGIARRLRARVAEIAFAGLAAFQAAELILHLMYGIRAVQGGPTHFAVMIAGVLGVAIGWRTGKRGDAAAVRMVKQVECVRSEMAEAPIVERGVDAPLTRFRLGIIRASA